MDQNGTTFTENNGDKKVPVNSIQRSLFVERLYVPRYDSYDYIIPYDKDNLYPQKVRSIAQRSGTTMGAIGTKASFLSGQGFPGMEQKINRDKQTLWNILNHINLSLTTFGGYALHFNYNALGQIVEINPVNFEFVRWRKDLSRLIVNPDWAKKKGYKKIETEYNLFNPNTVLEEIRQLEDIKQYNGQLLYWIPTAKDLYTTCEWDSVIDDSQFEAEVKLYSLSSIQNDYSLGGFVVLPANLIDKDQIDAYKEELKQDKGSSNAGGTRVFSAIPSEQLSTWKYFNPISRNNIDGLHKQQKEDAKFNIYAAFRQPPILNGVTKDGMFNQDSFSDAFHYYNSAINTEQKTVESQLSTVLQFSIWSGLAPVKIIPKQFEGRAK